MADYWVNFARHASRTRDVLHGPVRWPASIRRRIVCCGLEQTNAVLKWKTAFMRARLALFTNEVMKHHVSLE